MHILGPEIIFVAPEYRADRGQVFVILASMERSGCDLSKEARIGGNLPAICAIMRDMEIGVFATGGGAGPDFSVSWHQNIAQIADSFFILASMGRSGCDLSKEGRIEEICPRSVL